MKNETKNSTNYIKEKAGKKSCFSTPTNYFNDLEDAISMKLSEDNFTKETPFKVSDTYFENIEDRILSTITSQEKDTKVISLRERLLKTIPFAAAASIVLFIGLNSYIFNTDKANTLNNLTDDDIEYWLDSNTLNTSDIVAVLQDDILEENALSLANIEDESIEEYINSIDNSYLLNELKE